MVEVRMPEDSTHLSGLQEIAAYIGRSPNTLRRLIACEDFPAIKIAGEWTSDTAEITRWRRERIRDRRRREVKD